jgi:cell division protein ZapA (FtsZ GTPase activity inhibitor)
MAKGIKVFIGNKELNLKGDDEKLIVQSADLINQTLSEIGYKKEQDLDLTLSILTSLNIAEKFIRLKNKMEESEKLVMKEIENMSDFVEKNFK